MRLPTALPLIVVVSGCLGPEGGVNRSLIQGVVRVEPVVVEEMRVRDPNGDMKPSPTDHRALVRRREGDTEGPFYFVSTEGIDMASNGSTPSGRS